MRIITLSLFSDGSGSQEGHVRRDRVDELVSVVRAGASTTKDFGDGSKGTGFPR